MSNADATLLSQNVQIDDGNPATRYEVISDMSSAVGGGADNLPLAEFMARPIIIDRFVWDQNVGPFARTIDPWSLFFNEPRIINRITHYKRLRSTLHVRILITGNSFFFGRLICSYLPLAGVDQMTRRRALFEQDLVEATQRPYVMIDPTTSSGGELVLPFIYPFETLDIAQNQMDQMGSLDFFELAELRHVLGETAGVDITVFAWATDVQLSGSTILKPAALVPQSGAMDEYGMGIVSKPASIVANVAGRLVSYPPLAPYARATEMVARVTQRIATMLGYCRPVLIDPTMRNRPEFIPNIANTDGQDNATKLSLDSKQETTIDTRVMGLAGVDELNIKAIASRQCYIYRVEWEKVFVEGAHLFTCPVTPNIYRTFLTESGDEYHLTPMCFAGSLFHYWRGTIKFRFQVVASAYHRGRLRITYDPSGAFPNQPFNTGYSYVMDIAKERDFTVDVGWTSARGMLEFGPIVDSPEPPTDSPDQFFTIPSRHNGFIRVEVLGRLTTPSGAITPPIFINVFASAGDDIEFAVPSQSIINSLTPLSPQSGYVPQSGPAVDMHDQSDENMVHSEQTTGTFAEPPGTEEAALLTYVGETVTSLRTLLKRYSFNRFEEITTQHFQNVHPTYPQFPGKDPTGIESFGAPAANFTVGVMTPLGYVLSAFTMYRGAIRVFVESPSEVGAAGQVHLSVNRINPTTGGNQRSKTNILAGVTRTEKANQNRAIRLRSFAGTSITNPQLQSSVLAEIPYHSNRKFLYCKRLDQSGTTNQDLYQPFTVSGTARTQNPLSGYATYYAVGEDFQVGLFVGTPVFFEYNGPTLITV